MQQTITFEIELVDQVPVDELSPCCALPSLVDVIVWISCPFGAELHTVRLCTDCPT